MTFARRPLSSADLSSIRWLDDPDCRPDGGLVSVTETWISDKSGLYESCVLVVDATNRVVSVLPPGPAWSTSGRWSSSGKYLAVLGADTGPPQIWIWEVGEDRIWQLTDEPNGVGGPCSWSPDETAIVYPYNEPYVGSGATSDASYSVVTDAYKWDGHPVGYRPDRHGLRTISLADRRTRTLTEAIGGDQFCSWSPDGRHVSFISDRAQPASGSQGSALWLVGVDDTSLRQLTDGVGLVLSPTWSPDSGRIAFIGNRDRHDHASNRKVFVVGIDDGGIKNLTPDSDSSFGVCVQSDDLRGSGHRALSWSPGEGILCSFPDGGSVRVAWLRAFDQTASIGDLEVVIDGDVAILSFAVAKDSGQIAYISSDPTEPGELYICDITGHQRRRLTERNALWLQEVDLGQVQMHTVQASDGQPVQMWVLSPPGSAQTPRPVVLNVHGGPHWPTGWRFSFEGQRLASQGYVVAVANPRGSQGYGEAYSAAIVGDWGSRDYLDLLEVADHLAAQAEIDGERIVLSGVSYGGYLTCWAIGHTDRFSAAIAENSVIELASCALTTADAGAFLAQDLGAPPWVDPQLYQRLSPLTYAADIRTPLLLIHAEDDHNCPINQSEQLYAALRNQGQDVAFLRVPGEGHLMVINGTLDHRRQRWAVIDTFLREHLTSQYPLPEMIESQ